MFPHIVVFDSGVGGLSIVQSLDQSLGPYQLTYLFDNEFFPYGELSREQLILRVTHLLIPLCQRLNPDLLVIACNTASTAVLDSLRSQLTIPVVGVVPAIKPAAQLTKIGTIGLLATPATIHRTYTDALIQKFAAHVQVLKLGSSQLVRMAEQSLTGESINLADIETILQPWLERSIAPDVIVLGCTHFPLIREPLSQVLGSAVLIDSGEAVARRIQFLLKSLHRHYQSNSIAASRIAFYTKKNAHSESLQAFFIKLNFTQFNPYPEVLFDHSQDEPLVSVAGTQTH
ncbi:glutamate racemase [Celerinatantimonas sp. YJH-8]|uniref:glutamate racemase n=1 Tax=Celerinatantimonas sp. YJH-8 TaxID=3228714 RepID=UPI0038C2BCF4